MQIPVDENKSPAGKGRMFKHKAGVINFAFPHDRVFTVYVYHNFGFIKG
jgi:hypothetical protein